MLEAALFTLILIINNGGGDGKTSWSEALSALARLAGLRTAVLDIDPGLRGYSRRNGDEAAERVDWNGEFENGRDLPGWLDEAMAQDIALVDTGANLLAADKEVSARLSEIALHVQELGGRLIIHAVTSPNKPGSDEIVKELHDKFAASMEFVVIKNRRDGSNLFGKEIDKLLVPKVEVPYIAPGLQAYRLLQRTPLEVLIENPKPGYKKASALLANHLREIARNEHVRSLIADRADAHLAELASTVDRFQRTSAMTLTAVSDESIAADEAWSDAYRAFRNCEPGDTETFLKAALRYHEQIKVPRAA